MIVDKFIKDLDQDPLDNAVSIDDVFDEDYEDDDDVDDPDSDDDFEKRWYPD